MLIIPARQTRPTRAALRALLRKVVISDTDLRMLCIDYLPEMMSRFSAAMSYDAMLNAVIECVEPERMLEAMESCDGFSSRMSKHRHLLVPEPAKSPLLAVCDTELAPRAKPVPPPPKSAYDAGWYLERLPEEARARSAWAAPGAPIVLQAPELFGKTWLLMRLLTALQEQGQPIYINLKTLGEETLATFSTFLRELARLMLEGCALPASLLEQAWGRSGNPEANLNWLMSTQLLPREGGRPWLVLALDGADALSDKPYFDRFLTLLRGMAEQAAIRPWGALRLVLTLSSTIALRGQDIHRSPLENVAQIIPMSDLSLLQITQMAEWYGHDARGARMLMEYAGGHPFLIHLALHEAQHRNQSIAEILAPKSRVFDSYLQLCRKRLQHQPALHQALRAVAANKRAVVEDESITRLVDAGFLSDEYDDHDNRVLRLRYAIYRHLA